MDNVIFEKKQHTALITINKPHTLNALCESLISQINTALDTAENDPEIYTVIITGSGKTFIAGADIKEMYRKNETEIAVWAALGSDLNMRLETVSYTHLDVYKRQHKRCATSYSQNHHYHPLFVPENISG